VSGRVSPRWIEFRAKEENGLAHTWTITVDTADSAAENVTPRDTADITFAFPAGVSLLRLSLADLTPAEYMRLTIKNEEKDVDVSIMGVKVEFNVRPGQFAVTGAQVTGAGQN
jgi:pyruvate kinase